MHGMKNKLMPVTRLQTILLCSQRSNHTKAEVSLFTTAADSRGLTQTHMKNTQSETNTHDLQACRGGKSCSSPSGYNILVCTGPTDWATDKHRTVIQVQQVSFDTCRKGSETFNLDSAGDLSTHVSLHTPVPLILEN